MTDAKKIAEKILEARQNWVDAATGDEQRTWEAFVSASHLRDSSALARAHLDVLASPVTEREKTDREQLNHIENMLEDYAYDSGTSHRVLKSIADVMDFDLGGHR